MRFYWFISALGTSGGENGVVVTVANEAGEKEEFWKRNRTKRLASAFSLPPIVPPGSLVASPACCSAACWAVVGILSHQSDGRSEQAQRQRTHIWKLHQAAVCSVVVTRSYVQMQVWRAGGNTFPTLHIA